MVMFGPFIRLPHRPTNNTGDTPLSETDPTGRDAHTPGAKLDAGKPRVGLMMRGFARALLRVADVTTFGANKYAPDSWQHVPNAIERYDDAKARHALLGHLESNDPDSGIEHAAHEAWNALARLEFLHREKEAGLASLKRAPTSLDKI